MADCCYNLQTPRYGFWLRAYPKMSSVQESSGSAKKFGDGNIGARLEGASARVCDLGVADGCKSHQLKWF